jgi:hypothetical protein
MKHDTYPQPLCPMCEDMARRAGGVRGRQQVIGDLAEHA